MAVKCFVTKIGQSEWKFEDESVENNNNQYCCTLETDFRGQKLIAYQNYRRGDTIIVEKSLLSCPYGEHTNRICLNCLSYGHKQVKVSSKFDNLYFCSYECLNSSDRYLDVCGSLISHLYATLQPINMIVCVKYLYDVFVEEDLYLHDLIQRHEQHSTVHLPEVDQMTSNLISLIQEYSPFLCNLLENPHDLLQSFFRCLQFNSQPFDVPDLPKTSYLCFFNHVSRINHSCNPNSILSFHISPKESCIYCSVIALGPISSGEEITMSYLNQIGAPFQTRREFLQKGFQFLCNCSRCTIEENFFSPVSDTQEAISNHEIWNPIEIKASLTSNPFYTRSLRDRCLFLSQIETQIMILEKQWAEISSSWKDICGQDSVSSPSIIRSRFSVLYENLYKQHDLLIILVDALISSPKKTSTISLDSSTDVDEFIKKDILVIRLCNLLQDTWMLCTYFSTLTSSSEFSIPDQTLFGINFFIVSGGAASRLVKMLLDSASSMDRSQVGRYIVIARELVGKARMFINLLVNDCRLSGSIDLISGYRGLLSRVEKLESILS